MADGSTPRGDVLTGPDAPPTAISLRAEHSWAAAAAIVFPVLRPAGSAGVRLAALASPHGAVGNVDPVLDDGPAGLPVAYALVAGGFDVLANGDHLAAWGISAATLRGAALRNLEEWSATAPWLEEASDGRRILSSATGDGWDASRILLPAVTAYLEERLRGAGVRLVLGMPSRHLLVAGSLRDDDPEFGSLFAEFILDYAAGADEAIDPRVFELRAGLLTPFDPARRA
jgi:uncharacterized protein YtpQ (UPF0354 family)